MNDPEHEEILNKLKEINKEVNINGAIQAFFFVVLFAWIAITSSCHR